jgi:cytochrome c peroxidase
MMLYFLHRFKILIALLPAIMTCCQHSSKPDVQEARLELGQRLFFDTRLSFNNTKSCASCHDPEFAFSDGYRLSSTATGDITRRNSPTLLNASKLHFLDWATPGTASLAQQHRRPLFAKDPVELGASGHEGKILKRIMDDQQYTDLFKVSFPEQPAPVQFDTLIILIAEYVKSLQSASSPFDHYINGDTSALNESEREGMKLFFSNKTQCAACHTPPLFTLAGASKSIDSVYRNIGLYNSGNTSRYPSRDYGLGMITGKSQDDGKFKIPTLRNVAITAPYMHDGSVRTLRDVLAIYEAGGRLIKVGPDAGDGKKHPNKDPLLKGFYLTELERQSLIDFLHALSDTSWRAEPQFRNPFRIVK